MTDRDEDQADDLPPGLTKESGREGRQLASSPLSLNARIAMAQAVVARLGDDAPEYIKQIANQ